MGTLPPKPKKSSVGPDEYRTMRKRLGLSQQRLADRLGIDVATVSKRESGKINITMEAGMAIECLLIYAVYNIPKGF